MITVDGVKPVRVALVNDYDVVVIGLAHLFDAYRDRIVVAELATNRPVADEVDVRGVAPEVAPLYPSGVEG